METYFKSNLLNTVLPLMSCRKSSTVGIACRPRTIALLARLTSTQTRRHPLLDLVQHPVAKPFSRPVCNWFSNVVHQHHVEFFVPISFNGNGVHFIGWATSLMFYSFIHSFSYPHVRWEGSLRAAALGLEIPHSWNTNGLINV